MRPDEYEDRITVADAYHFLARVSLEYASEPALHACLDRLQRLVVGSSGMRIQVPVDPLQGCERFALPASPHFLQIGIDAHALDVRAGVQDRLGGAPRAQHWT